MELNFGTRKNGALFVEVISDSHTDWEGFISVDRPFSDCDIRDSFEVVRRYRATTDQEGRCYDWYEIKNHSQSIDKSKKLQPATEQNTADIAYIAVMSDIDLGGE